MSLMENQSRRFDDLAYQKIRECAQQGWLAVTPTGSTEQQGPHLSVDFDPWFTKTLIVALPARYMLLP